ncbi:energy transducer TonB [Granulicella sp. dw_53]|uniref:energy transducer TonB n=1 Tax=Granulicella sp. dw_53 TaxID=2719792 RepID=UPI001BD28EC9|nr:energy transducer TonB [Granulicella sp. dw_53]
MLQPLQLKDVSVRYAEEITELRDFLIKANCAVETVETLGKIVTRLPRDRAFHRDLTSYVWVVIDRCDQTISYPDLLGVLAIAAAGVSFAATADEGDAHGLLRFLMEARHALGAAPGSRDTAPTHWTAEPAANPSIEPFQSARGETQEISDTSVQLAQRDLYDLKGPQNSGAGNRRVYWMVAAACVIVALSIGLWLKPRSTADVSNSPALVNPAAADNVASTAAPERHVSPSAVHPSETAIPSPSTLIRKSPRTQLAVPYSPARPAGVPSLATHGQVSPQTMDAVPTSAPSERPSVSSTAPPALRAAGSASTPATTLSGRLGRPSVPVDSSEQGGGSIARTSKPPILLHRRAPGASSAFPEDGSNLASEVRPADVSVTPGSPVGGVDATRGGVIRLTSLGSMAANILYSPMPTYPAAASASHVQGEVKVKADIDRDGNVASVRIISGPPLLRDAALDAVQRWRYRPYMSSDGPTPMTAIAVMDFQLP